MSWKWLLKKRTVQLLLGGKGYQEIGHFGRAT